MNTLKTYWQTMEPEQRKVTLKALKASIAHWRRMATGKARAWERPGPTECALCALFVSRGCAGCPVRAEALATSCIGTPYDNAAWAWREYGSDSPKFKQAANLELNFLKGLLPE